jgi:hypothetical protein
MPIFFTPPGELCGAHQESTTRAVGVKLKLHDIIGEHDTYHFFVEVIGEALKQEWICEAKKVVTERMDLVNR